MKTMSKYLMLGLIGIMATLSVFAKNDKKKKSAADRLQQINDVYPYEVRVDRTTIPGKAIHWFSDGHSVTVTPHFVNCVYLTNTVDAAVIKSKKLKKDYEKAVKKDVQNVEKAIKDLKHLQEKSSEAVYDLFQDAIDIFEGK